MNTTLKLLGIALVLQIAVVIGLNMGSSNLESFSSEEPIMNIDLAKLDKLLISDGNSKLTFSKQAGAPEGAWIANDAADFPADAGKLKDITTKISGFTRSWPVAQTSAAFTQLKVADDSYERKLSFLSGTTVLGELILGTSPSFKKVHGRVAGDNYVYSLDLNAVDIPVNVNDWLDKEFLYFQPNQVVSIDLPSVKLVNSDNKFKPHDLQESEEVNEVEINALIGQIMQLRFTEFLGKDKKADFDKLKEQIAFSIEVKGQEGPIEYLARGPLKENFFMLKRSTEDYYFKVPKGLAEKIKNLKREVLVQAKQEEAVADSEPVDTQE